MLEIVRKGPDTKRPDRLVELTWLVAQETAEEMRSPPRWMPVRPGDEAFAAHSQMAADLTWRFSIDQMMAVDWQEYQRSPGIRIPRMIECLTGDYPADLEARMLILQERFQAAMAWPAVDPKPA
jgi:hypothetical protein